MPHSNTHLKRLAGLLAGAAAAAPLWAAPGYDLADLYGDEEFVSIATGTSKPIPRAPAVATVITAADIEALGATELDQVLETVPGLHVGRSNFLENPLYTIRGIYSGEVSPDVLLLINGIPATNLFHGDNNFVWGGMPVRSISRIEVIRGPGSAIYGANAFAGVINIVTKGRGDIPENRAGVRLGSFGSRAAWAEAAGDWAGFDAALTLELTTTDGHDETIPFDQQSGNDRLFGTGASLAPGSINTGRDQLELRLDLERGPWRLRGGLQGRSGVESGAGAGSLDDRSRYRSERLNADLTYSEPDFAPDWGVTAQASLLHTTQEAESPFLLAPPGTNYFGAGAFTDGMIGGPEVYEMHGRLHLTADYRGLLDHRLRLGAGIDYGDLYKVVDLRNFGFATVVVPPAISVPVPLGRTVDISDTPGTFLPEEERRVDYLFVQDEWAFAPDWELTAGLRYDHYSDVGGTLNPRLALVWLTDYDLTTKFLYGRAFRAPSFAELYNRNNPVNRGSSGLEPETIDTVEVAWDYRPVAEWHGALSLYGYEIRDKIELVADATTANGRRYQNRGRQTGYGLELEGEWQVSRELTLSGNLALQKSTDESVDDDPGLAPQRQLYLRADWRVAPGWSLAGRLTHVGDREREPGDTRPPVADYELVDLTLRRHGHGDRWDLALTLGNLFDEEAREPLPVTVGIPGDLPLAGRSVQLEASYRF